MKGVLPETPAVQGCRLKLLPSPVVPVSGWQVGAFVVPSFSASLTVIDVPVLKFASLPPPPPNTLNSAVFQYFAR